MTRNPFKGGNISRNSVGIGALTRKMVLVSAEELAIINGDWLHQVSASDFERVRQQATGEPDEMLQLVSAEELAIINGDWLHQVSASDFERARQQVTVEPGQMLHAARATARVESRLV